MEGLLFDLLKDLQAWEDLPWYLQAAILHHRAVAIHPFLNGNGRWARMLANIWLRIHGQPHTLWPEASVGATSVLQEEYLRVLRAADEGDYQPLQDLHQRYAPPRE